MLKVPTLKATKTIFSINSIALTLFACTEPNHSYSHNEISLQGDIFRIEVLPNSYATEDCGIDANQIQSPHYTCVEFPFASKQVEGKNWDAEYLTALDKNGWKWAGGEGNAYYLEKIASPECSYSLTMIGWIQGTEQQVKGYFDTGELGEIKNQTYIFALDEKQKCGGERNAN